MVFQIYTNVLYLLPGAEDLLSSTIYKNK